MEHTFTTSSIIKESYTIIKSKLWKVIGQYVVLALFFIAADIVLGKYYVCSVLISILFTFCSVHFALSHIEKDGEFSLGSVLRAFGWKKFGLFAVGYLLSSLAVMGGMLLLIVPGVIVAVQLRFVKFLMVDKGLSPRAALRESVRITKGHRFAILEYMLVAMLINLGGLLCLIVGVFFTIPLTLLGFALMYKKLLNDPVEEEEIATKRESEVVEAEVVEPA